MDGQTQFMPVDSGATTLEDIFGPVKSALTQLGTAYQKASNDWAALQAQNADIAAGRWTLNNAVYQFNQLTPIGQLGIMVALAYVVTSLIKKG